MTPDEARKALGGVNETERRLAERMRWPFSRHAMFGLSEALIVLGLGQPHTTGIGLIVVGISLITILMYQDRQRYGMFVSGWQGRRTKPLTIAMVIILLVLIGINLMLRPDEGTEPLTLLVAAITWAVCTALSMRWEKLYRAELREGAGR